MRKFDYMKLKAATWDSEILSYIAHIHEYKGKQDYYLRQKPAVLERLIEIAKIQSTEGSNKIEGIETTNVRLRQLVQEKTTPRNRDEQEIIGYRDILNTIQEDYDHIPLNSNVILQLHRDLLSYTDISFGGRFKNTQNFINETYADGTSAARFVPLAPHETPLAVESICLNYNQAVDRGVINSLILIPIFISDFLCIHPFNDGNGRISRLLTTLLLHKSGYTVGKYISVEKKVERTKDSYYDVLAQISYGWHEEQNDYHAFIKYFLGIILNSYRELDDRIGAVHHTRDAYDIVRQTVSSKLGTFTKKDVLEQCPSIGSSSVEAALKKLKEEGFILMKGSGRSTFYVRNHDNA